MIEAQIVNERSDLAPSDWFVRYFGKVTWFDTKQECIDWCNSQSISYSVYDQFGGCIG